LQPKEPGVKPPPIGIAFDGDLGNRLDAVLALGMLNGLTAKTEARRISLSVSRPSLKAAQLADVIASFYAGRAAGSSQGAGIVREGMIGMPEGAAPPDDQAPLAATLSRKAADGKPLYVSTISGLVDTPENSVLIRNLILAQHDQNAAIVLAGPATGLVRILGLYRSGPQIVAKVKHLVVALGSFSGGPADPSVKSDVAAARKLFAEWPTPLVAVGMEIGDALRYPASSIETGFGWSPAHPVADVYRDLHPMPYDAPASALAAVLYAAYPTEGYFKLSDSGTISVLDDGRTQFTPGANGRHRYLIADPAQKDRVTKLYTDLVSAPPAPRPVRNRPPAVAPPPPPPPAPTPIKL
jgi:purine nucleosidase